MYETVIELLDANGALVATLPALVTAKSALVNKTLEIRAKSLVQKKSTKGKTQDKAARKLLLADTSYGVAAVVQAYAAETENNDLYNLVNFTRTALRETEDEELAQVCQLIHDEANEVIGSLGDYGLTAAELGTLEGLITAWGTQSQAPRMAISERKAATQTLPSLFKASDVILKTRMDKLMENFRANERTFYDTYHVARRIVDMGHGPKKSAKLAGVVLNSMTETPIAGATVQIGDQMVMSGADGRFVMEKVPYGETNVLVTAPGFMDLSETGTVDASRDDIEFRLEPMMAPPPPPPPPAVP